VDELSDEVKNEIEEIAERAGVTTRWQDAGRLISSLAIIGWILYRINKKEAGARERRDDGET